MRGSHMQGDPSTNGVAHESTSINANGIKELDDKCRIVLHRSDTRRRLSLRPAGQLRYISASNSAQRHVICLPLAGTAHAVQTEDRGHAAVMAAREVRDVKATDLQPLSREDCAVCCSHNSASLLSVRRA